MSAITRQATNDDQEEAVVNLEQWAKNADYKIRYGRHMGKYGDTILFEHDYQDGVIVVTSEGVIRFKGEDIPQESDFIEAIRRFQEEN